MKLLTIDSREVTGRPGVLLSSGNILDLAAAPSTLSQSQWIPHSIVSVLAAGSDGLDRVSRLVAAAEQVDAEGHARLMQERVLIPFTGTALLPPIRRPGLVLVVHDDGTGFLKSPNTAASHLATIEVPWNDDSPPVGTAMLAAVVGRQFFKANAAEASKSLAGFTLILDLSMSAPEQSAPADEWRHYYASKQFPGACPIGPAIITADEFGVPQARESRLLVNGVEVSSGPAYAHQESLPERLAALSQRYAFRPGDLICFEPPVGAHGSEQRLHSGDRVSYSLPGLMDLDVDIG